MKNLTDDERESFEERAAIREFDGGANRVDAEREAAAELGFDLESCKAKR